MDWNVRKILVEKLSDDSSALWAGLMLRAEWMDEEYWWWAVYDQENKEMVVGASYNLKQSVLVVKMLGRKPKNQQGNILLKLQESIIEEC